jgi:hypothetical protein
MKDNKYLNEKFYKMGKEAVIRVGIIVLIVGLSLGGFLLYKGFSNKKAVDEEWTEANIKTKIEALNKEYDELKVSIKSDLDQITTLDRVEFTGFDDAYYKRQDQIKEIKEKIEPTQTKMDKIKSEIDQLENTDISFEKKFESQKYIPFFIFGAFVIIATIFISIGIFSVAYGREITAWGTQQIMPVAQEGIETMAPTVGHASGEMLKSMTPAIKDVAKEMAPVYGDVAKEVMSGIKEGLKEKAKVCEDCRTENTSDAEFCKKCGKKL